MHEYPGLGYTWQREIFLGCPLDLMTMKQTIALAEQAILRRAQTLHVAVNTAKLINMRRDSELRQDVCGADIINVDGAGVVWGARLLGIAVPERVAGIDLMNSLLDLCNKKGYRPYFLGARRAVVERCIRNITTHYPDVDIAGYRDGYFRPEEEADVVRAIRQSGADCLFVGLSSPLKERFNRKYAREVGVPFVMGVGGSLDVIAGHVRRAPVWMQRAGLEWAFRLAQEPRRMWRRYVRTNSSFAALVLVEIVSQLLSARRRSRDTAM
jgi:N-acetylglucosaminyldiphosphoundecaprenol N-acetyl-beta-D-mannosaminyltransferase